MRRGTAAQGLARLLMAAALVCECGGCTRGAHGYYGTTEPKHGPDEVWTNLVGEPASIDPGKAEEIAGGSVILDLFAGLVQPHPVTLEPMPEIAERWDVSDDGTRYTFHLRPSTWSDGTPLTAADFVYSWCRLLDPATGSKYGTFLYGLRYGEAYNRRALVVRGIGDASEADLRALVGPLAPLEALRMAPELDGALVTVGGEDDQRTQSRERVQRALDKTSWRGHTLSVAPIDANMIGVHALDDLTLQVDLETALPYFLHLVKYYVTMPVPRHVIERLAREGKNPDLWTRPEYIVGNGPYVLTDAKFRQSLTFEKNPRYWDAAHVKMSRVHTSFIESYNTTLNMYEAGELDSIGPTSSLPAEFMGVLKTQRDYHSAPYLSMYYYWINTSVPPLDDARVRNALRFAIDRQTLVDKVTRAGQIPSADMVPDGLAGYHGLGSPVFDPERARALLREAGYGPDHPLPMITLRYNTAEGHRQIGEAVQAMWREHLGIDVELENQEWKVFLKSLQAMEFQIARLGWIGDYPDPFTFLELLRAHNGNNHSNWSSPEYDALLDRANAQHDPAQRMALLREAEKMAMDAAPLIPLYVYTRTEMIKPYLMGHVLNFETRHLHKYWWIDRRWYHGVPEEPLPQQFPPQPLAAATRLR